MPPWPADSVQSLPMKNDPRMTPEDIREILDWIEAGAPKGADADISRQPVYKGGWLHPDNRPPDWVASLPKFTVPANGAVPYLRQLIKVPYPDDMWISALQVRAGNTVLLHHMGVTEVDLPEGVTPETLDVMDTLASEIGRQAALWGSSSQWSQIPSIPDPMTCWVSLRLAPPLRAMARVTANSSKGARTSTSTSTFITPPPAAWKPTRPSSQSGSSPRHRITCYTGRRPPWPRSSRMAANCSPTIPAPRPRAPTMRYRQYRRMDRITS